MQIILLAAGTIALYSVSTLLIKAYQLKSGAGAIPLAFMNLISGNAVFLFFFLFCGFHFRFTPLSLSLSVLYGMMLWAYIALKVSAAKDGPLAIVSLAYVAGGVLVPALFGFVFLDEPVTFIKTISFVLIISSFVPLIIRQKSSMVFSFHFGFQCLMILLLNGVMICISKIVQLYSPEEYAIDYVALTFFFYYLAAIGIFGTKLPQISPNTFKSLFSGKSIIFASGIGLFNAAGSVFNYMLAGKMPASVQFPLVQSSLLVTVTVSSLFLFQEKPHYLTIISILTTILGIIILTFS